MDRKKEAIAGYFFNREFCMQSKNLGINVLMPVPDTNDEQFEIISNSEMVDAFKELGTLNVDVDFPTEEILPFAQIFDIDQYQPFMTIDWHQFNLYISTDLNNTEISKYYFLDNLEYNFNKHPLVIKNSVMDFGFGSIKFLYNCKTISFVNIKTNELLINLPIIMKTKIIISLDTTEKSINIDFNMI